LVLEGFIYYSLPLPRFEHKTQISYDFSFEEYISFPSHGVTNHGKRERNQNVQKGVFDALFVTAHFLKRESTRGVKGVLMSND